MFNTKSLLFSTILIVVFMACYQQVSAQLTLKVEKEQNMFASPRQCACVACTCGGGTCPQSISARSYTTFSFSCATNQIISSYSVNAQSTDGSGFKYYTLSESNYVRYTQGLSFSYYDGTSSASSVTCVNSRSYRLDQQTAKLVIECTNTLMSCPIRHSISSYCTSISLSVSAPTRVSSGQTFTTTVKVVDSSANTITMTGSSIFLSWEGSGTLGGDTTATTSDGIATFSNSITSASATTGVLKATFSSGVSQTFSVSVQTGSTPSDNTDYTSAWVGTWKIQDTCDVNSCCCLKGSVTVTKSNTNAVLITSPVQGQCSGSSTMSAQVSGINSDTTLSVVMFGNPFTLNRNGNELTVVNQQANQCSGRAVKSAADNIKQAASLVFVSLLVAISFIF